MADDQEAEGDGNGHDNNEGRHHVIQLRLQGEMYIDGTASMGARLAFMGAVMVNVSDTGWHPRGTPSASVGGARGARSRAVLGASEGGDTVSRSAGPLRCGRLAR
jgi:hypothetical protein